MAVPGRRGCTASTPQKAPCAPCLHSTAQSPPKNPLGRGNTAPISQMRNLRLGEGKGFHRPGTGSQCSRQGPGQGKRQLLTWGAAVRAGWHARPRGRVHTPAAGLRLLQPGKLSCLRQSRGHVTPGKMLLHHPQVSGQTSGMFLSKLLVMVSPKREEDAILLQTLDKHSLN